MLCFFDGVWGVFFFFKKNKNGRIRNMCVFVYRFFNIFNIFFNNWVRVFIFRVFGIFYFIVDVSNFYSKYEVLVILGVFLVC